MNQPLRDGFNFRPMSQGDVQPVLQIIADHDEDDYENAIETYQRSLEGQYVLTKDDRAVGVTGAHPIDGTDRAFAISWTYLAREFRGRGLGSTMLEQLLDRLRQMEARKVFVHSSDYMDPEKGDIYRDARTAYRELGFIEELRHPNYYEPGEAQIAMGLRLQEHQPVQSDGENRNIKLTDVDEIPETDGAYWLAWELVAEEGTDASGFQMIFDEVSSWGGRMILMAFPSDVTRASDLMAAARFRQEGVLIDFYEDGVDEVHYRYDLRF